MINISKEEIGDKMFFVRDEDSNQPIAVIKVADLLEKEAKRMTNKEAIELLKRATMFEPTLENRDYPEALDLAIKALETLDDVNHKIYRNENCPQKNKCYDYQWYHCSGCGWEVKKNEIR